MFNFYGLDLTSFIVIGLIICIIVGFVVYANIVHYKKRAAMTPDERKASDEEEKQDLMNW